MFLGKILPYQYSSADHLTKILSTFYRNYRVDFNPKLDDLKLEKLGAEKEDK